MEKLFSTTYRPDDIVWKVKKDELTKVLSDQSIGSFEKHMIQEGVKQILFAEGTEEILSRAEHSDGSGFNYSLRKVSEEMIKFLLSFSIIEK